MTDPIRYANVKRLRKIHFFAAWSKRPPFLTSQVLPRTLIGKGVFWSFL
jgi:hypothetical protein